MLEPYSGQIGDRSMLVFYFECFELELIKRGCEKKRKFLYESKTPKEGVIFVGYMVINIRRKVAQYRMLFIFVMCHIRHRSFSCPCAC